jgi:hypothetical protein
MHIGHELTTGVHSYPMRMVHALPKNYFGILIEAGTKRCHICLMEEVSKEKCPPLLFINGDRHLKRTVSVNALLMEAGHVRQLPYQSFNGHGHP